MPETTSGPMKIDRRVVGDPIQVDGRTVQPVAHVRGWVGASGGSSGSGGGGLLRVDPVEVIVREANGVESTIPLPDPTGLALRQMGLAAGVVGAVCGALVVIAAIVQRRK